MNQNSINLRSANPTYEDGLVFAHYLDEAAEGFFRFMIGSRFEHVLATAFLKPNHDLSHQYVTFAEREGVIVGMVSGYSSEQHKTSSLQPLQEAAGNGNLRMRIVLVLFAPLLHIIDSISDGDFYLQAIAVDKELQGTGVGSILMDSIEEQAKMNGSTRLVLDVSAANKNACKFYSNREMSVVSQWPKRLPIPGFKLYRMTKVFS